MCGGLRSYLRMCGHDAAYALDGEEPDSPATKDATLARRAREEGRTLVTRDVELAERAGEAVLLDSREVDDQLRELRTAGVPLELAGEPTYCGNCNGRLARVGGGEETPDYAPDPSGEAVWRCRDCGQYFWKGSHWERVARTLREL